MKLVNARLLATNLQELEMHACHCDEERRKAIAEAMVEPIVRLSALPRPVITTRPNEHELNEIVECLSSTTELCKAFEWDFAHEKVVLILTHLRHDGDACDWSSLGADLRNAVDVVMTSLWTVKFISVATKHGDYVNNDALLGDDIKKAFPSAAFDLQEAANCIAVDCGTAAVFHLMRAVEWGLRALSVDLGVLTVPQKRATIPIEFSEWEKILDHLYIAVEDKIGAMPRGPVKQETQEFYFPLLQDVRGFKDAFRNHVMHTRTTYSQGQADVVLDYVRRFFAHLSVRISE
jgi:hypothetical protein